MTHYYGMEKNVGILIGGIAVAGVVAFLSINPSGSDQGSNPAPVISTSVPTSTSSTVSTPPTATPVDQSTSQVRTTPTTIKVTPTKLGGPATSIGSTGGGDDDDENERDDERDEGDDD
ncbi:MAG: hypothetical protein F2573_05700 [Actinobacteria bacterium]|uniref:Unannotated protein n=1 Tax=freshwater metagenome TaxID=449393 RepID=A0A6J7R6U3_9ZZZZ|nr:hypothetical protein [Actinomycetota bacterium]MTA23055.1 hypothetical protein [Actinomycetota bacterium]